MIDFHVHVYSGLGLLGDKATSRSRIRSALKNFMRPVPRAVHQLQPWLRTLPPIVRTVVDELAPFTTYSHLLLESQPVDLLNTMDSVGVERAVLIASPPFSSNEFMLDLAAEFPTRFTACVNIPPSIAQPAKVLRDYQKRGARLLKIHPAMDGEGPTSDHYRTLIPTAIDLGLPIILHTGCMHSHLLYKKPALGNVETFRPWFKDYPEAQFILAHMNFHEPQTALDLCVEFQSLMVDTSWQPAEIIGEAVRRIGSTRVLMGSDWPLVGDNMRIAVERVREALHMEVITPQDQQNILSDNAKRVLCL